MPLTRNLDRPYGRPWRPIETPLSEGRDTYSRRLCAWAPDILHLLDSRYSDFLMCRAAICTRAKAGAPRGSPRTGPIRTANPDAGRRAVSVGFCLLRTAMREVFRHRVLVRHHLCIPSANIRKIPFSTYNRPIQSRKPHQGDHRLRLRYLAKFETPSTSAHSPMAMFSTGISLRRWAPS